MSRHSENFSNILRAAQSATGSVVYSARSFTGQIVYPIVHHLPFRHRHILTRHNHLRWRYKLPFAMTAVVVLLMGAGSLSGAVASYMKGMALPESNPARVAALAQGRAGDDMSAEEQMAATQKRMNRYGSALNEMAPAAGGVPNGAREDGSAEGHIIQASLRKPALPDPRRKNITIGNGDTMAGVLQKNGVSGSDAYAMIEAMKDVFDPRDIRPGQKISVRLDPVGMDKYALAETNIVLDPVKSVKLSKGDDGIFKASLIEKQLDKSFAAGKADIDVSLYGSAVEAGIPASVVADVIGLYSWDVDFQRDIRHGDAVEVMYEKLSTKDGDFVKTGNIIYARLNVNGQDIPVYRYQMKNGDIDYFTADGKSVRKALMQTPINGARISSGFGKREHPVLGYTKMHKGVDFAAPRGTPIFAAGDGTIERMGPWSSFGNYVRIRHNSELKTAYAHMKGFAKGLHAGSRVKQGQIIGYVGTTGRSTGPHLHYEVIRNGTQVNPKTVKLPQGEALKGNELAQFKEQVKIVDREFKDTLGGHAVAMGGKAEGRRYN